jgi:hypothetical protein
MVSEAGRCLRLVYDSGSRREIRGRLDTSWRNNGRLRTGSVVISNSGQGGGVEDRGTEDCAVSLMRYRSHCHSQNKVTWGAITRGKRVVSLLINRQFSIAFGRTDQVVLPPSTELSTLRDRGGLP